jgi:tetratricopeptide (TPR) repeat protein
MTAAFCSTAFVKGTAAGRFRLAPNPGFIRDCSMPLMPEKPFPVTSRWLILWSGVLLVVLAVVAYHNSFSAPFNFDDESSIINNATIRTFWPIWNVLSPPATAGVGGRPLVNLTLALNYAWGGVDHVWGYHAVNLAIHIGAGLVLWGLVRRTLLRPALRERFGAVAPSLALVIAILWVVHPLQTESVTYLSQRTEALMGLFYLLTLYGFVRSAEAPRPGPWQVFSVAACLLGVLSKEVIVTAPAMVLLYDRTFVAGSFRAAWWQRWRYYLALAGTWLVLGYLMTDITQRGAGFGPTVTGWEYALTSCRTVLHYLWLTVWPHPLVLDYGTAVLKNAAAAAPQAVALAALIGGTIMALRWRPAIGFLGAWFLVTLAPTTSFVPVAMQPMAEHRMYLPLAAVVAGAVAGLYLALGRRGLLVVLVWAAILTGLTIRRNAAYQSTVGLWTDTVVKCPGNARAHSNLGRALIDAGKINEAMPHLQKALALKPDYAEAHGNLAAACLLLGRPAEAKMHGQQALTLDPNLADARNNLGLALVQLNQTEAAIEQYRQAIRIRPIFAEAWYNLGNVLRDTGQTESAIVHFKRAVFLKPDFTDAHLNLANVLRALRRVEGARQHYELAIQLSPNYASAYYNFGIMLMQIGQIEEARINFARALRIDPAFTQAREFLTRLSAIGKPTDRP